MPKVGERYRFVKHKNIEVVVRETKGEETYVTSYPISLPEKLYCPTVYDKYSFWHTFEPLPNPESKEKLPEVGSEWIHKKDKEFIAEILSIRNGEVRYGFRNESIDALEVFTDCFEPLPSTNQQEESKVQVKKSILSDEVMEAMEEMKKELIETEATINRILKVGDWCPNVLIIKAQNLLNALESLDDSNIPEKGDCGIVEDARNSQKKHPIQPIILDDNGTARFKENKIVSYLLDKTTKTKICDLNDIAIFVANGTFSNEDREQLAQLIGYSVGGAADLSYMSDEIIDEANKQAESLMNKDQVKEEKESELACNFCNKPINRNIDTMKGWSGKFYCDPICHANSPETIAWKAKFNPENKPKAGDKYYNISFAISPQNTVIIDNVYDEVIEYYWLESGIKKLGIMNLRDFLCDHNPYKEEEKESEEKCDLHIVEDDSFRCIRCGEKQENPLEEKPKSIWRDVKELPENAEAVIFVNQKTQYECPKHGEHEDFLQSNIMNKEGVWCNICVLEKLDELGINRMTKIKKLEEKK